jgi:hypothetical protein
MDETYRMLGKEHEADLEREAVKRRRAAEVRKNAHPEDRRRRRSLWQGVHDRAPGAIRRAMRTVPLGSRTAPAERPAAGD